MYSEAGTIAGDLLAQFPSIRDVDDRFIYRLTDILQKYPRQIVLKCADPRRGIARDSAFLSFNLLVAWLEKHTEPMRADVSREQRVKEQLAAREDWEHQEVPESLKAKGKAWLDRSDPKARELMAAKLAENDAQRLAGLDRIQAANESIFARECARDGIDPERRVSSTLLKTLGAK
jgi:hypothetical protein